MADEKNEEKKTGTKRTHAEMEKHSHIICPYLDTIDRSSLDFDFEKLCCVSLTNLNVYVCLVCGKYFQGRAKGSPAYNHSLSSGHHVFLSLETAGVFCLPDLYEVHDASLADIKYNLNPTYTPEQIDEILTGRKTCRGLDGKEFRPGLVGLNNLKMTDYLSALLQVIVRIPELCKYYMSPFKYPRVDMLTLRFGELIRKIWNVRGFKGDPVELLQFLLNALHEEDLKGQRQIRKKEKSKQHPYTSIIHECCQGRVRVITQEVMITEDGQGNKVETNVGEEKVKEIPFMHLQFELPDTPLFKDESERNIIPQVPLFTLLHKYDGEEVTYQAIPDFPVRVRPGHKASTAGSCRTASGERKDCTVQCNGGWDKCERFKMNYWFEEKNKTIVNFPVKSLDMRDFCNLCHDGSTRGQGNGYFAHVFLKNTGDWWHLDDLDIKSAEAQEISCTAPYIQVWECQEYGFVPGYKPEAPPPPPAIATKPTSDTGKDATAPGAAAPGPGAANGQKAVGPDSNGQAAMVIDSGLAISAP